MPRRALTCPPEAVLRGWSVARNETLPASERWEAWGTGLDGHPIAVPSADLAARGFFAATSGEALAKLVAAAQAAQLVAEPGRQPHARQRPQPSPRQLDCLLQFGWREQLRLPPPSFRDVGDALGIASLNGVSEHIQGLVRKGYLRTLGEEGRRSARNHVLTEAGRTFLAALARQGAGQAETSEERAA